MEIKKEDLVCLYLLEGLSLRDIGQYYGCSYMTIFYWMRKYGIPTRSQKESLSRGENHYRFNPNRSYRAIHKRIQKKKVKPENCVMCNESDKRLVLANLGHKYQDDIRHYIYICDKCHNLLDKKIIGGINS